MLTPDRSVDVAISLFMLYFGITSIWYREFGLTLGNSQIILNELPTQQAAGYP